MAQKSRCAGAAWLKSPCSKNHFSPVQGTPDLGFSPAPGSRMVKRCLISLISLFSLPRSAQDGQGVDRWALAIANSRLASTVPAYGFTRYTGNINETNHRIRRFLKRVPVAGSLLEKVHVHAERPHSSGRGLRTRPPLLITHQLTASPRTVSPRPPGGDGCADDHERDHREHGGPAR